MITTMKRIAYLIIVMINAIVAYADGEISSNIINDPTVKNLLPQFNTFTPEAASLGKYGTYGMTEYSGVPNISVPLFSIKSGNFALPVEISYDASGIKVEQEATYVGLGWNLIMGGSINHIVCGKNDFDDRRSLYLGPTKFEHSELNYLSDDIAMSQTESPHSMLFTFIPDALGGNWTPKDKDKQKYNILRDVSEGYLVPDIFQASFFGHNVSFVINQDSTPYKAVIISDNATKYKIDIETKGSYLGNITITDDNGMHYVFSHFNYNEFIGARYSYYLYKVIDSGNRCLAEYNYQQLGVQSLNTPYFETNGDLLDGPCYSLVKPFTEAHNSSEWGYRSTTIRKVYPESITTLNEKITFKLNDRKDDKSCKLIKEINVNSLGGMLIHKAEFDYGYYKSLSENNYTSRLKLIGVKIDDKNYSFEYNGDNLPSMTSKGQDYWGYYNGKDLQKDFCASPRYKIENNDVVVEEKPIGNADRFASAEDCKIGILKRINFPTGGYTVFDYDINHFNDTCNYFYPPSGSRTQEFKNIILSSSVGPYGRENNTSKEIQIKKTTILKLHYYCYCTSNDWFKSYHTIQKKNDSGVFGFFKEFLIQQENKDGKDIEIVLEPGCYRIISTFETTSTIMDRAVTSCLELYDKTYYNNFTIKDDVSGKSIGGGLRIKSMYSYDSSGELIGGTRYSYKDGKLLIPTVRKEIIQFSYSAETPRDRVTYFSQVAYVASSPAYSAICSLGSSHIGYSTVIKEVLDKNENVISKTISNYHNYAYTNMDSYNMFYESVMGMNGKLKERKTYSLNGTTSTPMHSVRYNYSRKGVESDVYVKDENGKQYLVPSVETVFFPWCRTLYFENPNLLERNFKYSIYPKRNIWTYVTSVVETNYADGKAMKPVITNYQYNESNYQPSVVTKTVEISDNIKDIRKTICWYPQDNMVVNEANQELKEEIRKNNLTPDEILLSKHCISEKTIVKEYRNDNLVGGFLNYYIETSKGKPVVEKCYSITPTGENILEIEVDPDNGYDDYGNIREYKKKDGTPVTILWSYNHQYPVMEIVGKKYSDIRKLSSDTVDKIEKGGFESNMTSLLNTLHSTLRKNQIMATAYEYSPWYTVTEIIQPNGNKTRYTYDKNGRLEIILDANQSTFRPMQRFSYNYKIK